MAKQNATFCAELNRCAQLIAVSVLSVPQQAKQNIHLDRIRYLNLPQWIYKYSGYYP